MKIALLFFLLTVAFGSLEINRLRQENESFEKRWVEQENIIHTFQLTGLTGEETVSCCIKSLSCEK